MPSSSGSSSTQTGGIHVYPYLDDWLVKAKSQEKCHKHVKTVMDTLHRLGFSNNHKKSSPYPEQVPILNSKTGNAYPVQKRTEAIEKQVLLYQKDQSLTVRTVMRLMGMLASCIPLKTAHEAITRMALQYMVTSNMELVRSSGCHKEDSE